MTKRFLEWGQLGIVFFVSALALGCGAASNTQGGDGGVRAGDGALPFVGDAALSSCPQGNEAIQTAVLVPLCASCHGASSPQAGLDLVSAGWVDRLRNAPSQRCPGQTLIVPGDPANSYFLHKVADSRPACGTRMPPGSTAVDPAIIACLQAWIQDGLQPSDPGTPIPTFDAGTPWTPTPGTTPPCDENTGGTLGGRMCPGADCLSCHNPRGSASDPEQLFTVAGTVFHSPTDAVTAGFAGLTVHIVDSSGASVDLRTNSVGNFYTTLALAFPVRATVTNGTTSMEMPIEAPTGSCNSCHTLPSVSGTSGRVYFVP